MLSGVEEALLSLLCANEMLIGVVGRGGSSVGVVGNGLDDTVEVLIPSVAFLYTVVEQETYLACSVYACVMICKSSYSSRWSRSSRREYGLQWRLFPLWEV